jgi:hypothetical protein
MNAKEIIEKFKEILLSKPEEVAVEAIEVQEEVVLSEQKKESLAEEPVADATEDIVEDVAESEDPYATKEELAQAIAQMKAMYDQIMESMSTEVSKDAPAELVEDTELSAQEEVAVELTHSPEEAVNSKTFKLVCSKKSRYYIRLSII